MTVRELIDQLTKLVEEGSLHYESTVLDGEYFALTEVVAEVTYDGMGIALIKDDKHEDFNSLEHEDFIDSL